MTAPAAPAAADDVGPFSYVGFEAVVEHEGETSVVSLFDDGGTLRLSQGGGNGTSVSPVSFAPGYGWSEGPAVRTAAAGVNTDEGVHVAGDWNARGVYAVDVDRPGQTSWESRFPAEVVSFSYPYVVAKGYGSGEWRLLAVGSTGHRAIAAGAQLIEDVLVEPVVGADGRTRLTGRALDPGGDPAVTPGDPFEVADLGVCDGLQHLVNDSWWLVHRCGSGPALGRDLLSHEAEDVPLRLARADLPLTAKELPDVRLADGWLAYALDGELRLVDLRTGEDGAVLPLRGANTWYPVAYEVSVARSGWAVAVVPEGSQGETVLLLLSDDGWETAADPYAQWYAARSAPAVGRPVGDPEQLFRGSRLPAASGALHAWVDESGSTPVRRVHEVRGGIGDAYEALGGPDGSVLGYPLTDETASARSGAYNLFERGGLYWSPATGAHEVHGGIRELWSSRGAEHGFLGYPRTDELGAPGGAYNDFEGGSVYWSPATGAHEVHGGIRERWHALGGPVSVVGYPVTDERATPRRPGAYNHFQRGSIYWSASTGAREVRGGIRDRWVATGGEEDLGFPVTDELSTSPRAGAYNHFERGSVYWSPATGAVSVRGAFRDTWARLGWENSRLGFPVTEEAYSSRGVSQRYQGGTLSMTWSSGRVTVTYS